MPIHQPPTSYLTHIIPSHNPPPPTYRAPIIPPRHLPSHSYLAPIIASHQPPPPPPSAPIHRLLNLATLYPLHSVAPNPTLAHPTHHPPHFYPEVFSDSPIGIASLGLEDFLGLQELRNIMKTKEILDGFSIGVGDSANGLNFMLGNCSNVLESYTQKQSVEVIENLAFWGLKLKIRWMLC